MSHVTHGILPAADTKSVKLSHRRLFSYRLPRQVSISRYRCCLPNILLLILIVIIGIGTVQVVLFARYGDWTATGAANGNGISLLPPVLSHRYEFPTRRPVGLHINLRDLLSRNVASISAHARQMHMRMNERYVNALLEREENKKQRDNDSGAGTTETTQPYRIRPACPEVPPNLVGRLFVDLNESALAVDGENYTAEAIAEANPMIKPGGKFKPNDCLARHKIAIIIPYRDREHHLMVLMAHLHPVLQRQQIDYTIYVVEQAGKSTFNKARIMNIAFVTALEQDERIACFVFHDVDLVPEDDRNLYTCPQFPRHMSVAIDTFNYHNPYEELVGGVFVIRTEHFIRVNGYSNLYWGWGAEDDDMAYRMQHVGLPITRPPAAIARYKMIRHQKRKAVDGRIRYRLLWTGVRRYRIDGVNSLPTLKYNVVHVDKMPVFTHILVDIGTPPVGF